MWRLFSFKSKLILLAALVVAVTACGGGIQFEREAGVERLTPLPLGAEVLVVESMKDVPSGSQTLGILRIRRTPERFTRPVAEKQFQAAAASRGCDLLADVREQKFDGTPRRNGGVIDEYEWSARCIRTAIAAEAANPTPAPVKEKESAKEREKDDKKEKAKEAPKYKDEASRLQAELAAAKEAAKKAAKLAAEKEEQLKELAEKAEKEKKRQAAEELERQKREKEQAEKEKVRAAEEAADKARAAEKAAEKARAAAEQAEKDRKKAVADASEKAKIIAEAPTPANFKAVADAGEKVRALTEAAEKAKQAAEQADKDARKASDVAAEKAKALENDKARAEAVERERKAREEAERKAKDEAERKAKDEAERKAKEDADRKAKEDVERKAKEDAERKAKESGAASPVAAPVAAPVLTDRAAQAKAEKEAKAAIAAEKKRQEAEKKRLEAEAKRQELERRKAEAAAKKRAKDLPAPTTNDSDAALKDGSVNALLANIALRPEADPRVLAALDQKVAATTGEWVAVEGVVVSTIEDERGPKFDADIVAKDVEEAHASGSRFLTPREYSYRYTLRNPSARTVALDVELPGQRVRRVIAAGQQVAGQAVVPCIPHGSVRKAMNGNILEYHFDCNADSNARIVAVRPVERELQLDKRAADAEVPLEVISRVWQGVPGTLLTGQYAAQVDEIVRRRLESVSEIRGSVAVQHKSNPDAPTAVLATIRNGTAYDATVLFDVGTGREQRLIIARGQSADMKLDVPPGVTPEFKLLGVVPRLRSLDWLLGLWSFRGARMVVLPGERGQWNAFLLPNDNGRVVAVALHAQDGIVQARVNAPAAFVKALYGNDTPGSCEDGCELRWTMRMADMDQYVAGAGRALAVEFDAADRRALVKFAAEH